MDSPAPTPLTVDNCDKEPIHIPGRIQPFGALIAGPLALDRISYCSANLPEFVPVEPSDILGAHFKVLLDPLVLHDIRNVLSNTSSRTQRERVGSYDIQGRPMEVFVHANCDSLVIVELEPLDQAASNQIERPVDKMRSILARASQEKDLLKVLRTAVLGLRALTGYDRVKAYRYAADGSGEVVAEARDSGIESFLGLHYPAWDVPAQARALQVKNPVRMLSDIRQDPIDVLAHEADAPPLDLSLAHLRGISPIHVQYLENMGVGATMTIGLVVEGELWGMLSCHHMTPKVVTSEARIAAELFGQFLSLVIQQKLELSAAEARARAAEARRRIIAETQADRDLLNAFKDLVPIFQDVIDCDGLAITRDGKVLSHGSTPGPDAIREIAQSLPNDENLIEGSGKLIDDGWANGADLAASAGCLLVRATAAYPLQLMFFRDEVVRSIKWAGKPQKQIEDGEYGPRITPRGSFKAFIAEQKGRSTPWQVEDVAAARELQVLLTQITAKGERELLVRHNDLVTHQRQQDLLIAELNHRVKNILALIRSLSRQAKASSASLESYALALEQRISALASAHDLAVSGTMNGVSLRGILETELQPYMSEGDSQILISGETIGLRADVAPMIALVFHEMVTNAAKYGALSSPDGIVRVKWTVSDEGLSLSWKELNGPPVEPPKRHGFGQALISKAIPYEFDGTVDLQYDPAGVAMSFSIPKVTLVDLDSETPIKPLEFVSRIHNVADGKTALLVEDNIVLAMDMVESLSRLGAARIETASTVDGALIEIDQTEFDFAVLDMNLRGVVSFAIAKRLKATGVPFIFVTGYGSQIDVPSELCDIAILTKPIEDGGLSTAIAHLLGD